MKRIFVDTNVLLDLLLKRRNFSKDAEGLFHYCKKRYNTTYIIFVNSNCKLHFV